MRLDLGQQFRVGLHGAILMIQFSCDIVLNSKQ